MKNKLILGALFLSFLAGAQSYIKGNILYETPTVTTATGGTTALTVSSQPNQVLTGVTTHTHSLPDVQAPNPDIAPGMTYKFQNNSTTNWFVTYADASPAYTIRTGEHAEVVLTSNSTTNGTWAIKYKDHVSLTGDTMTGGLGLNYVGVTANTVPYLDANRRFTSSSVDSTELSYLDGVTSSLQTQLNAKVNRSADTMTGPFGLNYVGVNPSTVAYLNAARQFESSSIDPTELGYLDGSTANIQTQINSIMGGVTGNYVSRAGDTMTGPLQTGAFTSRGNEARFGIPGVSSNVIRVFNATNDSRVDISHDGNFALLTSTFGSTGGYKPWKFQAGGLDAVTVNTNGSVGILGGVTAQALGLKGLTGTVNIQAPQGAGQVTTHTLTWPGSLPVTNLSYFLAGTTAGTLSWSQTSPQVFETTLAGTSTYTTPTGAKWLRVRIVGGGGGGGGSVTTAVATAGAGGAGGNTLFGVTALVANGGTGGGAAGGAGAGGTGGSFSFGGNVIPVAYGIGGSSNAISQSGTTGHVAGSIGAVSFFGGAGGGGVVAGAGGNAAGGTGSGGGGAGGPVNGYSGAGGGAGGYAEGIILNPAASYSYTVGAAGTSGTAGTGGAAGGAGAQGRVIVEAGF